ncbi:MAG: 3'(2'),5'-bisphosphate nucleotidase CysQ [Sporichthyaceae bacterium]
MTSTADASRGAAHAADFACEIADAAGAALLALRADWTGTEAELRKAGDAAGQQVLAARLAAAFPGDAVLSEEARDSAARLSADRVWIIDPLDGTREFSEGRRDWAVHVALWERTVGDLTGGAVALPAMGRTLTSAGSALPARGDGPVRIAVSRSRPPAVALAVADALGAELVAMGSAGVKVMAVVLGEVDAYVHGGGQYEWDSAAPVAVARAAGAFTSRLDGSPLVYNQADPHLPDLVVCRPEFADAILAAIAAAPADPHPTELPRRER